MVPISHRIYYDKVLQLVRLFQTSNLFKDYHSLQPNIRLIPQLLDCFSNDLILLSSVCIQLYDYASIQFNRVGTKLENLVKRKGINKYCNENELESY